MQRIHTPLKNFRLHIHHLPPSFTACTDACMLKHAREYRREHLMLKIVQRLTFQLIKLQTWRALHNFLPRLTYRHDVETPSLITDFETEQNDWDQTWGVLVASMWRRRLKAVGEKRNSSVHDFIVTFFWLFPLKRILNTRASLSSPKQHVCVIPSIPSLVSEEQAQRRVFCHVGQGPLLIRSSYQLSIKSLLISYQQLTHTNISLTTH